MIMMMRINEQPKQKKNYPNQLNMPPGKILIEFNLINRKLKCATLKVMVAMMIMMMMMPIPMVLMMNGSGGDVDDGGFIGNDNDLFILRIFVNTLPNPR